MRKYIQSLAEKPLLKRLYWTATLPLVGIIATIFGIYLGVWVAFGIFVMATILYEIKNYMQLSRCYSIKDTIIDSLSKLRTKTDVDYEYEVYHFKYEVSETEQDYCHRFIKIKAKDKVMYLEKVLFGGQGSGVKEVIDFTDLRVNIEVDKGDAIIVPFPAEDKQHWKGNIIFIPHILPGESRNLKIHNVWPDLWAPLRRKGVDQAIFRIPKRVQSFQVEIIFPLGVEGCDCKPLLEDKTLKEKSKVDSFTREGKQVVVWTMQDIPKGIYTCDVICLNLPQVIATRQKTYWEELKQKIPLI